MGDMDSKVAGTDNGITALQMDIKIDGITTEIMQVALKQAKEGREHILGLMKKALKSSRTELSQYAPRIMTLKIHPDKIRDVIGKGGAVIKALTEETNTLYNLYHVINHYNLFGGHYGSQAKEIVSQLLN